MKIKIAYTIKKWMLIAWIDHDMEIGDIYKYCKKLEPETKEHIKYFAERFMREIINYQNELIDKIGEA